MNRFKKISLPVRLLIVLIIVGLGWFGYSKIKGSSNSKPQYQTAQAEKGTLIVSLTASGQVSASNSRTVTTTASGVVNKVFVKEGQKVTTGTPILSIELDMDGKQKLQAAYSSYQSAQNNLISAQNKIYDLQSTLVGAKNIFDNQWANQSPDDPTYIQKHDALLSAQAAYDNLQNTINQAKSSLESARLSYQLSGATVYAPISGTVSAISLTPGMILNPTSSAANSSNAENKIAIVKTGATPTISVSLTEIDVTKVHVGDKATITLDAFSDKTFTGKVIAVDTSGTVSSGVVSYPTTIQLDSDVSDVLPNMSATANIITKVLDNVIMVPAAAVQTANGQTTVRQLKDGQLVSVDVEAGDTNNTNTVIVSGVNEGDTVVTSVSSSTTTTQSSSSGSVFGNTRGGGFIGR